MLNSYNYEIIFKNNNIQNMYFHNLGICIEYLYTSYGRKKPNKNKNSPHKN